MNEQYGHWEVIRPLGEGGQGVVYLASDRRAFDRKAILERITHARLPTTGTQEHLDEAAEDLAKAIAEFVKREDPQSCGALKVLHASAQGPELEKQLDRMKAETEALRSLDHPSIIRILDQNLDQRWFIMQYFPDGPLSQHISKFAGNFTAALRSFRPLVEAVAEMHKKKLVHRDIKPENVFVSSHRLVLGDLGLVHFIDDKRSRISVTFENVGSRDWMPGWAMGMRIDEIQPSFDVFSLGKLLWSMICGQPKLQLWYHHKDRFELGKMFPNDPDIRWARSILDRCIVEEEKDCIRDANELLQVLDTVLAAVQRHAQVVSEDTARLCSVCGLSEYLEVTNGLAGIRGSRGEVFRVFFCPHCGHADFFYGQGARRSWGKAGALPTATRKPPPKHVTPGPAEARVLLDTVDLGVEIYSGHAQNFAIQVTNYSDYPISVVRIRMESNNVEVTRLAEPKEKNGWVVGPRAKLPIAWNASPEPALSLTQQYGHRTSENFQAPIDFILQCELFGAIRRITKRLIVSVDSANRYLHHVVG